MKKNINIALNMNTKDLDETVLNEIKKNIICDIQELINEQYSTYLDDCEIDTDSKTIVCLASSLIGKKVRVKKYINGSCYASIPVGSVGKIAEIRDYDEEYAIGCKFEGIPLIKGFFSKELEIIE